jgi:stalled ribosome alternative rescue factor ArfA
MPVTSGKRRASPKSRAGRKMKAKRTVKHRSAAAAALASPVYRKRVVKNAKAYKRKGKIRIEREDSEQA